MAISTKFVLRKKQESAEDQFAIMLQIIIDRKNLLVSTRRYSGEKEWQPKSQSVSKIHPKHKEINLLLRTIESEVDFMIISFGKQGKRPSFEDVKALVKKLTGGQTEGEKKKLFVLFEEHIAKLRSLNRLGSAESYVSTLKSLKNFTNQKDPDILSIGLSFLNKYENWLIDRGCSIVTRSFYLRTFRTLWKAGIKEKYYPETHYPFKDFSFSKYNNPRTKKRAITRDQIELIASAVIDPENDSLINSRNYFLFSFYCRGLNFTDLAELKWTNIVDEELHYVRSKTKEEFRFRLHPAAIQILEYYRDLKGNSDAGYLFPILYKRHATIQSIRDRKKKILTRVNKQIKELGISLGILKPITTYVARHSYATALRRNGISKETIGRSLGHDSLKTTDIYLEDIGDPLLDELINSTI
ncbi:site-specific integrase [Dyadobacter chenhuakuii]|jgi:integrase/recombinase XerD|uniref:Site-specific integrase n=1 Tax=Dyadobacter chenhuakuii TaxID=2909339 RepID=A0ABY4XIX1_9BACT|nr:site-specific integrase [Dyadobacter chenhuakuii]MCF2496112.1 site-specific integrase [Dyadobacter chenhuakuii]USJ30176.1 site-specific integrase [Dyadobacter chenhuakuii]